MKKLSAIIVCLVLVFGVSKSVVAQNDSETATHSIGISISEIALVDIEADGSNSISLNPTAPTEAGLGVNFTGAVNSDLWLNYSSIVNAGKSRSISAKIAGSLPGGATISVMAAAPQNGKGSLGSASADPVVLTTGDLTILSGIGSCYTGDGFNNGSNLTYKLNMDEGSYENLVQGTYSITVTYTISDDI